MIIVLILTSIVVALAFSVLGLVQKHMRLVQDNYVRNSEISLLKSTLWMDFNRYPNIYYNSSEDKLNFMTELDSISYRFTDNVVIREQDTFKVFFKNKQLYFNGELTNKSKVDAIKLEMSEEFQSRYLFVYKLNDANTFMN
jgi:hypothetical protein